MSNQAYVRSRFQLQLSDLNGIINDSMGAMKLIDHVSLRTYIQVNEFEMSMDDVIKC